MNVDTENLKDDSTYESKERKKLVPVIYMPEDTIEDMKKGMFWNSQEVDPRLFNQGIEARMGNSRCLLVGRKMEEEEKEFITLKEFENIIIK